MNGDEEVDMVFDASSAEQCTLAIPQESSDVFIQSWLPGVLNPWRAVFC